MPDPNENPYLTSESPPPLGPKDRVHRVATKVTISPDIADDYLKVTQLESGHNVNVRNSSKGAQGFGQVMPDVKGGTTRTVGGRKYNLKDPDENIEAGLRYFAEGGDDPVARRLHYFGGPGARTRYERTGKIPNISDGNLTAEQYVKRTGGYQQKQEQNPYLVTSEQPPQSDNPYLTTEDEPIAEPTPARVSSRFGSPRSKPVRGVRGQPPIDPIAEARRAIEGVNQAVASQPTRAPVSRIFENKSRLPVNPSKIEIKPRGFQFNGPSDDKLRADIRVEVANEVAMSTPQGRAPRAVGPEVDAEVEARFKQLKQQQKVGAIAAREGPSMSARDSTTERLRELIRPYTPGLNSLDTPMGIKTDLPRGIASGLTLGAIGSEREITPEERIVNPNAGNQPLVSIPIPVIGGSVDFNTHEIGEMTGALVPLIGGGKALAKVGAKLTPAARTSILFGGLETGRQAVNAASGREVDLSAPLMSAALGAVMGKLEGLNPSLARRIVANVSPGLALAIVKGTSPEDAAKEALTNFGFAIGMGGKGKKVTAKRIGELRSGRTTVPAETQEQLTRSEQFDRLEASTEPAPVHHSVLQPKNELGQFDGPPRENRRLRPEGPPPPGVQERRGTTVANPTERGLTDMVVKETTERRAAEDLAHTDTLTGLPNKRAWESAKDAAEKDDATSIVMMDIRNAKAFNAEGQEAGDPHFKEAFAALEQAAEEHGVSKRQVFRVDGDEGAVVVNAGREVADAIAKRAQEIYPEKQLAGSTVGLSVGVGSKFNEANQAMKAHKATQGVSLRPSASEPSVREGELVGGIFPDEIDAYTERGGTLGVSAIQRAFGVDHASALEIQAHLEQQRAGNAKPVKPLPFPQVEVAKPKALAASGAESEVIQPSKSEVRGEPNVAQEAVVTNPVAVGVGQGVPAKETAPTPSGVARLPVGELSLDPERFQYKLNKDAKGSTGSLAGVQKWNDQFAGLIQVWRDPADGKTYVVNGHNRYNKAVDTKTERVNVQYIEAATAKEARAAGAKSNIASGDGTAIDAAQYFRDSGESPDTLKSEGLPLNSDVAKNGIALSKLNDFVFNAVRRGEIPEGWGVAIGAKIQSPDLQSQAYKAITKAGEKRSLTKGVVDEILDQVSAAPRETQTEQTLFGDFDTEKSLFAERAQVAAAIKRQLSQDKSLFGTAARKSGRLAEGGTTVDVEQAKQLQESAAEALGVFDTLKNTKGDISEILDKGAKDVASGKRPDQVAKETYAQIKNAVNEAIRGRVKPINEGSVEAHGEPGGEKGAGEVAGASKEPSLIRIARESEAAYEAHEAGGGKYRGSGGPDTRRIINKLLIKGYELYKAGKPKFDEWVKKMREHFGSEHDAHLPDIYARLTSSQKVDEVLRKARSLPQTLEASGREKGTELEYDVLPNPTTIEKVSDRIAKDGIDKTEEWYRKAEPSAERSEAFRQIGDQLLTQGVYEKDPAKGRELIARGTELANTEAIRSTTLGQTIQAYSINTKFSPSGALREAVALSEKAKKDLSPEDAEYITRKAVEHQEADTNVKALQEQAELFEGVDRKPQSVEERIKQSGADPQVIHGATRLLKDRDMGRGEFYREMKKRFGLTQEQATTAFHKAYRLLRDSRKEQVEANRQAKIRKENPTADDKTRQEIYDQLSNELKRRREAKMDLAKAFRRLERTNRTYWDRLVNLQRALMVSRFTTAVRNAQTQFARGAGVEAITDAVETTIRGAFRLDNPLGYRDAWGHFTSYLHLKGQRAKAESVLQEFPTEHEQVLGRYASDVDLPNAGPLSKGAETLFGKAEQGAAMLNWANTLQEFTLRSAEFNTKLNQELKRMGKPSLNDYLRRGKAEDIPIEAVRAAAQSAQEVTFAERPGRDNRFGNAANSLIDIGNSIPATVSPIGFPRYFYSSMKFMWEYNPTGFLTAGFAKNTPRAVGKALVGTAMLLTAYQVREHDGGEKWYELYIPGTKQIVDMRPFGPFSLYLFVAEAIRRGIHGEQGFTKRELADAAGIAATRGAAGTVESVYDILTNQSQSIQAKAWKAIKRTGGETVAAFLSPVQQLKDVVAAFDKSEGVRKDVGTAPFTGPIRENIPYASRGLPDARLPTTGEPIHQENPLLKLLTGYRVQTPKNFMQKELDRLKFNPMEVYKSSGIAEFDNRVKQLMGERIESIAEPRSHNLGYKNATDARKRWILREDLRQIRKDVIEQVEGEMPEAARKLKLMRQSKIDRGLGIPPDEGGSSNPRSRPSALERPARP